MGILLCEAITSSDNISSLSGIAQVVIALANLGLAAYLFLYRIRKDNETSLKASILHEQSIKLQWFKELVIQPNMESIDRFYKKLHGIQSVIASDNLTIEQKETINERVKDAASQLRKSFVDVVIQVDKKLGDIIQENLDKLVDSITEAIFNDELKLTNPAVYEKKIGAPISYSRNTLISQIYNYKGLPIDLKESEIH